MIANGVLRQELGAPMKGRVVRRVCRACAREVGFLKNELCLNCYATAKKKGLIPMNDISSSQEATPEAQAAGVKPAAAGKRPSVTDAQFRAAVANARSVKAVAKTLGLKPGSVYSRIKRMGITPPWGPQEPPPAKATPHPTLVAFAPPSAPTSPAEPDIAAIIGGLPYNLGRAIECLYEAAKKGSPSELLENARGLVERELSRVER